MKVLRIYNHLGKLEKEFNVYVEGQDFKWQASVPECVWLGTIALEEVSKEPEPVEVFKPVEEPITEKEAEEMQVDNVIDALREQKIIEELEEREVKNEPKAVSGKGKRVKRVSPSNEPKSIEVISQDNS